MAVQVAYLVADEVQVASTMLGGETRMSDEEASFDSRASMTTPHPRKHCNMFHVVTKRRDG